MSNDMQSNNNCWGEDQRIISVIVDNPSWILPYAKKLVDEIKSGGDKVTICSDYEHIEKGCIAFFLGCTKLAKPEILVKNKYNIVVHESDLPKGKGFAPVAWQVLEGKKNIPICLLDAVDNADSGDIYYKESIALEGHELHNEIRDKQGNMSIELCLRFLSEPSPPKSCPQTGKSTFYKRRTSDDSKLSLNKTIDEQFNLLRTVDNERYPAFFDKDGFRYKITIEKMVDTKCEK